MGRNDALDVQGLKRRADHAQWGRRLRRFHGVDAEQGDGNARQGNFAAAQAAYDAALKVNPNDVEVLNNLANVYLKLKNPGAAVKTAEFALTKEPGNASVIDTLGWALFQTGQNDRALQLLRDARLRQPGNPEIHFHLASVLAEMGRTTEAKEEVETALKLGLNFESASDARKLLAKLN